jgi:hypothetical protein
MNVLTYNAEEFVNVSVLFYHATNPGVSQNFCVAWLVGWLVGLPPTDVSHPSFIHPLIYRLIDPCRCSSRRGICARWNSRRRPRMYVLTCLVDCVVD